MNKIIESLYNRKSVRVYEDKLISPEDKKLILESALQAPTAGNMTLYTILDITDQSKKERLAVTCDNQPFIARAPIVLIFCADYSRWYNTFLRNTECPRKPDAGDLFLAMSDTIIAAQNAVVAAESLGIGSCYIGDILENYEIHRELLSLPKYVLPICMLCFGYPNQQQKHRAKPARFNIEDIVHENGYDIEKSRHMDEMLLKKESIDSMSSFSEWLQKFCKRKWDSDFSIEMSRSVKAMLDSWME